MIIMKEDAYMRDVEDERESGFIDQVPWLTSSYIATSYPFF